MSDERGHDDCYARALLNCSEKLSREHYVSASVLSLLGDEHRLSNVNWVPPGERSDPLPVGALASKILCERHNSALSPLDGHARVFFSELMRGLSDHPEPLHRKVSVNADAIEKWFLKACCGALASGNLREGGRRVVKKPPCSWLDILFGDAPFPAGTGLHIRHAGMIPFQGYSIGPVYIGDEWVGGGIIFAGVEFFISMVPGGETELLERSTGERSRLIYRPAVIRIESPPRMIDIELEWKTWITDQGVRYRRRPG